jgi:hypothetical protein
LTITGKRLDAQAPSLHAEVGKGWISAQRFFPGYVVFSTPGCWQVGGRIDGYRHAFVTLVIREGAGPAWRPESIP